MRGRHVESMSVDRTHPASHSSLELIVVTDHPNTSKEFAVDKRETQYLLIKKNQRYDADDESLPSRFVKTKFTNSVFRTDSLRDDICAVRYNTFTNTCIDT